MGPLSLAVFFVGGLVFDMGINAAQNWYDVVYQDAFWTHRVEDSPALRQVSREELEIDRLMRGQDFVADGAAKRPITPSDPQRLSMAATPSLSDQ
jgi:hypothetical protein